MTFLELCQTAQRECGVQGGAITSVTGRQGLLQRIVYWVAQADLDIQSKFNDWKFLRNEYAEDTITGQRALPSPSLPVRNWDTDTFCVNYGTTQAQHLPVVDFKTDRLRVGEREQTPPQRIVIMPDNSLQLTDPADGIYTIYGCYNAMPTPMIADDDKPPYDATFDRLIIERTKMFFFEDQEAWDNYQAAQKSFELLFPMFKSVYLPQQAQAMNADAAGNPWDTCVRAI